MRTHLHPRYVELTHHDHGGPAGTLAGTGLKNGWARVAGRTSAPALVLMVSMVCMLMSACGQQPSQELLNAMNARLAELEKKIVLLEDQDVQLTEFANDAKATSLKLEEKITELTTKIDKLASLRAVPAAQKPAQPPAAVPQGKQTHHTVTRGETLYSIAKRYGLSVDELRRLNNLNPDQPILAGQKLVVSPNSQE